MKLKAEFRKIVAIVSISDIICCQNEIGFFLTSQSSDVTDELMAAAGTNEADIGSVMETLPERIEETKAIFSE